MTIVISHRGNYDGTRVDNHPQMVEMAIDKYHWVEADVWLKDGYLWLGHDEPTYGMEDEWFQENSHGLILHAKHGAAAAYLAQTNHHWFAHDEDAFVSTSKGWLWCYNELPQHMGIVVCNDFSKSKAEAYLKVGIMGVCTDKPDAWLNYLSTH